MSNEFDASEFVDDDFQAARKSPPGGNPFAGGTSDSPRAPSREEVDSKVGETQQKLAELKRIQQDLERERAALEETRRRQLEFSAGRRSLRLASPGEGIWGRLEGKKLFRAVQIGTGAHLAAGRGRVGHFCGLVVALSLKANHGIVQEKTRSHLGTGPRP